MIIRPICKEDINKGLLDTLKEVWNITEIKEDLFNSFISQNIHTYVVELNDEIIGCASLYIQTKLIRDGGIAGFIEDVVVREKFRGKKIGSELIQKLIEKGKDLGCYKIILSCFPERVNFYETNGFYNESITMRLNLK